MVRNRLAAERIRDSRPLWVLAGGPIPGRESSAGHVHVSALTYCTTMTTCPSGLSAAW